ncbi:MAG: phage tail protein, partial [Lactobacillus crispatus]|nr:phage tail protein [Lactobacillus crispatus]
MKVTIGKIPEIIYTQYDELLSFPHLYKSINSDFTTPGFTLSDALTCDVTFNFNQYPTLQMTYPRDGNHMEEIQKDRWILEDCGYKFPHQKFKITHVTQELDQVVVNAEHLLATLNDCTLPDGFQLVNASPQDFMNQALNQMVPAKDIIFDSKVSKVSNVNVEGAQQVGSLLINPDQEGDQAVNSIPGLYGGELEFDNNEIHHSEHAGMDTGIVIDYGKNMSEFQHDISTENMWTGAVFIAKYIPGQAVAKADWDGWASWSSDYSNVGIYAAGGTVEIFNSPVEGHQAIGALSTGMKLHLGTPIHDGDFTSDGKYQINTVNGDDWYPVAPEDGGGFVDARWISFDKSGSYMVNDITGSLTVQAQDPNDSSGAGSRVSMSGNAVVAYKPGGEIHV